MTSNQTTKYEKSNHQKNAFYFEKIGDNFDLYMSQYDVNRRGSIMLDVIKKKIPNHIEANALEIGCGTGKITSQLKELFKSYTVSDLSEKLAQSVSVKYDCISKVIDVSNASNCFEYQGKYDIVISSEVIEHTPAPADSIINSLKMINNQGYILLTTPNRLWMPVLHLANVLKIRKFQGNECWLWPSEILQILEANHFTILEKRGCHLFPWQFPLAKQILPYIDKFGKFLFPLMINFIVLAKNNRLNT